MSSPLRMIPNSLRNRWRRFGRTGSTNLTSLRRCSAAWDLDRWVQLDLRELARGKDVRFCRCCSDVEIDGEIYSG